MEMPEGKQRQPNAEVCEAALWYLRSKAKELSPDEMREFWRWVQGSPKNLATLLQFADIDPRVIPRIELTHALSLTYYKHVKRQTLYPKIGLIAVALCGVACWMFLDDLRPLKIAAVAVACFLLMLVREAVLRFRVENGYFGGTESEVRDFLEFITKRRGEIDFTDQGGKRRPALVPEPPPPNSDTSAAAAPTGVLSE